MKRTLITLAFIAVSASWQMLFAQQSAARVSLNDINEGWAKREIALPRNVVTPSVTQLVRAFNDVWRTEPGDMVVLKNDNPKKFDKMNSGIDARYYVNSNRSGNFLESIGVGDAPWMQARTWIRSNGHRFFAVAISEPDGGDMAVAFYDFNPDNSRMVPDTLLAESLRPETEVGYIQVNIPEEGDEITVNEHIPGWNTVLGTTYKWDGMNLQRGGTAFTGFHDMIEQYKKEVGEINNPFSKFALIDIDGDGTPELWLRSENDYDGAFYCMGSGNPQLMLAENWKIKGYIAEHGVMIAGSAGTGAFYAQYVLLENSTVTDNVYYMSEYNMVTENMDIHYHRGDKEISIAEGERATARVGNTKEVSPSWHPLMVY